MGGKMRFDWYAATVPSSSKNVINAFRKQYHSADFQSCSPVNGYHAALNIMTPHGVAAKILYDGPNGGPHVFASGQDTDTFVPFVRRKWPAHNVTRLDAAEDFDAPGAFDALMSQCLDIADNTAPTPLVVEHVGDWHRAELGRTIYLGSRKSAVRLRLYEKGKQLRNQAPDEDKDSYSPDWVRLELQIRPQKSAKAAAATILPIDAFGYAGWSKNLAERVFKMDVPRVQMNPRRLTDDDRAFAFMLRQYGNMLERMQDRLGGWCHLGVAMGEHLHKSKDQNEQS